MSDSTSIVPNRGEIGDSKIDDPEATALIALYPDLANSPSEIAQARLDTLVAAIFTAYFVPVAPYGCGTFTFDVFADFYCKGRPHTDPLSLGCLRNSFERIFPQKLEEAVVSYLTDYSENLFTEAALRTIFNNPDERIFHEVFADLILKNMIFSSDLRQNDGALLYFFKASLSDDIEDAVPSYYNEGND